jgi:putative membrane protein
MFPFILVIIAGIVFLVFWLTKMGGRPGETLASVFNKSSNKGLEILKQRYAKGEISKDDFESMKKDIA